jgi:elongation factor P
MSRPATRVTLQSPPIRPDGLARGAPAPVARRQRGKDMYGASDLRKGIKVEIEGQPYAITEFNFVKPGKGQAVYTCKMKNMVTGATLTRNYRSDDKIDEPHLEERKVHFSYAEGDMLIFMDEEYNQVSIAAELMGDRRLFLKEDMPVEILFHNGRPIDFTLPYFVEKQIIHADPGVRGDTATNVLKPATVEGGYQIQVPLFVNQGDVVRIDTRTGEYVDRVAKR